MKHRYMAFLASLTVISTLILGLSPLSAEAATRKTTTRKKVAVSKTVAKRKVTSSSDRSKVYKISTINVSEFPTKCLTKDMISLNQKVMQRLTDDIAKYGKNHSAAAKTYRYKVEMNWAAMSEPYCGFGSLGLSAVKHSYNKGVERARAEFLALAK